MIKYAKIIDEENGLVSIGDGTDIEFYKSIGMEEMDVQQSDIDSNWYLIDKCPMKTDEEKEKERRAMLDSLNVTRGDMFEALLLSRGITKPQIRAMIEQYVTDDLQKALFLNRFDEALDFYRGYPVFDLLGAMLKPVITPEQWDNYFLKATDEATKAEAYKELLPVEAEVIEETSDTDHPDQSSDMVKPVEENLEL